MKQRRFKLLLSFCILFVLSTSTYAGNPTLKIEAITEKQITLLDGEDTLIGVKNSESNPEAWTYTWFINGLELSNEVNPEILIIADNKSLTDRIDKYKLIVRNTTNDLEEVFEFEILIKGIEILWLDQLPESAIEGDEFELRVKINGGINAEWDYTWINDNLELESKELKSSIKAINGTEKGHLSQIIFNAKIGDVFNNSIKQEFKVYSYPSVQKESLDDIVLLHGQQYTFKISTNGGNPDGWSFEWFINSQRIENATSSSYTATMENIEKDVKHYSYKVIATNTLNNSPKSFELIFNAEVWPAVSETHTSTKLDINYGDSMDLSIHVNGGYDEGWTYLWSDGNQVISNTNIYKFTAKENNSISSKSIITLNIKNEHAKAPNGPLFQKEIIYEITSWSLGVIDRIEFDSYDYRSEDKISISVVTKGGYPNWEYFWYHNDKHVSTTKTPEYTFTSNKNNSTHYILENFKVVAHNIISGKSNITEKSVDLRIWPTPYIPNDFHSSITEGVNKNTYSVMEGDVITFNTDFASGGYYEYDNENWIYTWYKDNVILESTNNKNTKTVNVPLLNKNNKYTKTIEYGLKIENFGPENNIWYSKSYDNKTVKIYARPQTPSRIIVKGNGKSNTAICLMDLNDNLLLEREYKFVFGYTDRYGKDFEMEPTTERWCQYPSEIQLNNKAFSFWVYALWDYDAQNRVTSGRAILNGGIDKNFNATYFDNVYIGTRGETTNIDINTENKFDFDGKRLIIESESETECIVTIYSFDGKIITVKNLGRRKMFNELLNIDDYDSGIYIVNINIGENIINRKIVVP